MDPSIIFIFLAGIFIIGFFGNLFFKKTRISDIFFLLVIGFLLGSGLNVISGDNLVLLKNFSSFFGALALIILMFEGGLHLNFYKVIRELNKAAGFTVLVFLLSILALGTIINLVFGFPFIYGILIGSILGGVSSAIVIPLIKDSKAGENTKTLLTLESAITDSLCVVIVIAIVQIIIAKSASVQMVAQSIISAFAIATVIGFLAGVIWLTILRDFETKTKDFSYFLTLSFLFIIYVLIEFANGNGAFGVLVFGIVLGNGPEILNMFRMKEYAVYHRISRFQSEITLFIKTFFFIYLGIIVEFSGINLKIILIVIAAIVVAILARVLAYKLLFRNNKELNKDSKYIVSMHARGLAAAVLATYPITMGITNSYTIIILPIAFLVIILTNLTTTIFFFISEKQNNTENKDPENKDPENKDPENKDPENKDPENKDDNKFAEDLKPVINDI